MAVKWGYKKTDIGVIPEDWDAKAIGSFAVVKTGPFGTLLNASEYSGDGVPLISVGEVREGFLRITEKTPRIPPAVVRRLPQYVLREGDIVFGRKGAVERSAYINPSQDGWFLGSDGISIRPIQDLHGVYLAFQFQSHRTQEWLRQNSIGTTMPSLNQQILKRVEIPLPALHTEQEAIAEVLSDVDVLIGSLEQLLIKKRQMKQGAMQELLTGKKRLPGFNGKWTEQRLGASATLKARIGWQGLTTAEYLESGDHLLVTGTEFLDGRIVWSSCWFVDELRYRQDKYIQLNLGDVLVTKDGTIGKVALVTDLPVPATLNSGVFVIRPTGNSFVPEFFFHLLTSNAFEEFLSQLSAGSTINHLYQKDFVGFRYKLPVDLNEQFAIAAILSDMDAELAALETKLTKARQLKQGMMQVLLTGQIRLPLDQAA